MAFNQFGPTNPLASPEDWNQWMEELMTRRAGGGSSGRSGRSKGGGGGRSTMTKEQQRRHEELNPPGSGTFGYRGSGQATPDDRRRDYSEEGVKRRLSQRRGSVREEVEALAERKYGGTHPEAMRAANREYFGEGGAGEWLSKRQNTMTPVRRGKPNYQRGLADTIGADEYVRHRGSLRGDFGQQAQSRARLEHERYQRALDTLKAQDRAKEKAIDAQRNAEIYRHWEKREREANPIPMMEASKQVPMPGAGPMAGRQPGGVPMGPMGQTQVGFGQDPAQIEQQSLFDPGPPQASVPGDPMASFGHPDPGQEPAGGMHVRTPMGGDTRQQRSGTEPLPHIRSGRLQDAVNTRKAGATQGLSTPNFRESMPADSKVGMQAMDRVMPMLQMQQKLDDLRRQEDERSKYAMDEFIDKLRMLGATGLG